MSLYLRTALNGGVIAAFLVTSTMAAPPVFKAQNRTYGNSVYGNSCSAIENGTECDSVSAWENYDVKGMYEYSEVVVTNYTNEYDPSDGSWSSGNRYLNCPVDRQALSAKSNRLTLGAVLDPGAPGCYFFGYICSWDPINGYQFEPWSFTEQLNVVGEWRDPFNYSETNSKQNSSYHDGWSGTTSKYVDHCKYTWGDAMQAGGFSVNERSFVFEGPYARHGATTLFRAATRTASSVS